MAYKMPVKESVFERGDSGIGKIRFSTNSDKIQVVVNVEVEKDQFVIKKFLLDPENCPDNIDVARNAKEWMVQMSSQGDKLMSFRPVKGAFVCTTKEFAAKKDSEPTPKLKEVDFKKSDGTRIKYDYSYFTIILEIVEPEKLAGVTFPLVLHYNLAEFVDDSSSIVGFSMGGKYTEQLKEYMIVSGILDDKYHPMKFSDNLLPLFQKIALKEARNFQVTIKDGWVVPGSLIEFDSPDIDDTTFDESEIDPATDENVESDVEFEDDNLEDVGQLDFEPDNEDDFDLD